MYRGDKFLGRLKGLIVSIKETREELAVEINLREPFDKDADSLALDYYRANQCLGVLLKYQQARLDRSGDSKPSPGNGSIGRVERLISSIKETRVELVFQVTRIRRIDTSIAAEEEHLEKLAVDYSKANRCLGVLLDNQLKRLGKAHADSRT